MNETKTFTVKEAMKIAQTHHNNGELQEAFTIYQKLIINNPNDAEIQYAIGTIFYQTNQFEKAITQLNNALSLKEDYRFYNSLGASYQALEQYEKSLTYFQKSINLEEKSFKAMYNMGESLRKLGNYKESINHFKESLKISIMPKAFAGLCLSFIALNDLENAIISAENAMEVAPNNPFCLYARAKLDFDLKQYDKSEEFCQKALKSNPNYAEAFELMGSLQTLKSDFEQASQSFEQAIKLKNDYGYAFFNYGICAKQMQNEQKATELFKKAADLVPNNPTYQSMAANFLYANERIKESFPYFKKHYDLKPNDLVAINNYGAMLIDQLFLYEQAIVVLEHGMSLYSSDKNMLFNLVSAYVKTQNNNKAKSLIGILLDTNPHRIELENKINNIINKKHRKLSKKDINLINSLSNNVTKYYELDSKIKSAEGDFAEAMNSQYHNIIINLCMKLSEPSPIKQPNSIKNQETLLEIREIFNSKNILFFLTFGNLLSAVRGKNHLENVEIGIFIKNEREYQNIITILQNSDSFSVESKNYSSNQVPLKIICKNHNTNINIDIFLFRQSANGKLITGIDHSNQPIMWEFDHFTLKHHNFLDCQFLIPSSFEEHLIETYGTKWSKMNEPFDKIISAQNILEQGAFSFYMQISTINNAIKNSDFSNALKMLQILKENDFSNNVTEMVENHLKKMI